jgi:hypothetical protein
MAAIPVPITEAEASRIRFLRQVGVLEEIYPDRIARDCGTLIVPCSDGHHFADFYTQHMASCAHDCGHPMHHPIALNGGALLIPEDSPLLWENGVRTHDDETLLRHIRLGTNIKGPRTVILATHAPCGMVKAYGLSIDEAFPLLFKAKDRVRKMFVEHGVKNVNVIGHIHVYFPDERKRTYHVHRAQWDMFGIKAESEMAS